MKLSNWHQSNGFTYRWLVHFSHAMMWGYFKKIHLHNRKGVPSDKPVLLAVNHPTAFTDPLFLCIYLDPPIYNMTRGDMFKKPLFKKLLTEINMFPVYRIRDGYKGRDRNDDVFDYCFDLLHKKRCLAIYVEGEHHLDKRVRPIQKGIVRLAFGAMEKYGLDDLLIIPVGCNYAIGDRPRDEAMVNIGDPIHAKDYFAIHLENPALASQQLTQDIEAHLRELCFDLHHPNDDRLAEQLLTLQRSDHWEPMLPPVIFSNRRFLREKTLIDRLNHLPETEKETLQTQSNRYFQLLQKLDLQDFALRQPHWGSWWWVLFFIAVFPAFIIGYLTNRPVVWAAHWMGKNKVKKREFKSSVMIGAGFITGMIYYCGLFIASLFTLKPEWIAAALVLPGLGYCAVLYQEVWANFKATRRALQHPHRAKLLRMRPSWELNEPTYSMAVGY